jgi:hypothetical protein
MYCHINCLVLRHLREEFAVKSVCVIPAVGPSYTSRSGILGLSDQNARVICHVAGLLKYRLLPISIVFWH